MSADRAGGARRDPERACYLLPLRSDGSADIAGLTAYLRQVSTICDVLVVDGSAADAFARHGEAWSSFCRHIRPDPRLTYLNGKVNGVITGVRATSAECVIIADDDVRHDAVTLVKMQALLEHADLVVPQNYFDPLPWHAAWDSARTLLNRSVGVDYPGTVAVRRRAFLQAGCYDGDVLFENLELIRTLRAAGARVVAAPELLVRRLPPTAAQFAGQRVRQAYDSLAQPLRLAAELALLPAAAFVVSWRPRWRGAAALAAAALAAVGLAERGRRRAGGQAVFPAACSWLAPAWLAERALCSWLALGCRIRGGVRYAGHRLPRAATPLADLRALAACRSVVAGTETRPAV